MLSQIVKQENGLREIIQKDNPAIASIIRAVMPEFGAVGPGYAIEDPEVDRMYEAYQQPRSSFYVVEMDGQIVGGGGIAPLKGADDSVCELQKFYILTKARGRGLGRQLIEKCLQDALSFGYERCYIETLYGMDAAVKLYEAYGFTDLPAAMGTTGHHKCNRWMIKDLKCKN